MLGPFIRILLRVVAGFLIGRGLPEDWARDIVNDPGVVATVEVAIGAAIWGFTEVAYAMARRFGWKT